MKRIISLILVIFCIALLFVSCKKGLESNETTKESTVAVTGDDVTDKQTTAEEQTTDDPQTTTDPWTKSY